MAQQGSFSRAMQPQLRVASCALQNAFSLFSFSAGQGTGLSPVSPQPNLINRFREIFREPPKKNHFDFILFGTA